nr:reverse transcriptase domain-containing protein [Tanacetum cinerariifolium]
MYTPRGGSSLSPSSRFWNGTTTSIWIGFHYQKRLNLTKPNTYRLDLKRREAYTAHSNPRGFIYQNKDKKNRLMRIDELYKFNDGTLNDVRNALDDRLKGIQMHYLSTTIWRRGDKDRAAAMIQAIEKMLKTRRILRSLEKFVGGRLNGDDVPPGGGELPVLELRTMEELCQPTLNRQASLKGWGGLIAPIAIQATNLGLKNDMIQQVQNSCQFHGLSGTFQRCMMAIFHDMIKKTIEVLMDDFLVFGNSFQTCLYHLERMLKRCEDINLCLNWEKSHFMVKEGIVLGHKISKNGIEVDKAKVNVIAKLTIQQLSRVSVAF